MVYNPAGLSIPYAGDAMKSSHSNKLKNNEKSINDRLVYQEAKQKAAFIECQKIISNQISHGNDWADCPYLGDKYINVFRDWGYKADDKVSTDSSCNFVYVTRVGNLNKLKKNEVQQEADFNNCQERIVRQIRDGNNFAKCEYLAERYKEALRGLGYEVNNYKPNADHTKVRWDKQTIPWYSWPYQNIKGEWDKV